jgi:hypothetical protein
MIEPCLTTEELVLLVDGEATETRAAEMRAHVSACPRCRRALSELETLVDDLEKAVPAVSSADAVDALMARIARVDAPKKRAQGTKGRWAAGIGALLASAAAWMLLARVPGDSPIPGSPANGDEFRARGGSSIAGLERDVSVELHMLRGQEPVELVPGAVVERDSKYVASYRNVRALERGESYMTLFALDQEGVLHWLYPAYEKPGDDPSSPPLARGATERAMPSMVVLDRPSVGAMRFVALVTTAPLRVSQIEALSAEELTLTALRRHFPGASLREWSVEVAAP